MALCSHVRSKGRRLSTDPFDKALLLPMNPYCPNTMPFVHAPTTATAFRLYIPEFLLFPRNFAHSHHNLLPSAQLPYNIQQNNLF